MKLPEGLDVSNAYRDREKLKEKFGANSIKIRFIPRSWDEWYSDTKGFTDYPRCNNHVYDEDYYEDLAEEEECLLTKGEKNEKDNFNFNFNCKFGRLCYSKSEHQSST